MKAHKQSTRLIYLLNSFNPTNFTTKFSTMSIQIQTHKHDSARLKVNKIQLFAKNDKKQVMEQGLPSTALEGSWTEWFWTSTAFGSLRLGGGIASS